MLAEPTSDEVMLPAEVESLTPCNNDKTFGESPIRLFSDADEVLGMTGVDGVAVDAGVGVCVPEDTEAVLATAVNGWLFCNWLR